MSPTATTTKRASRPAAKRTGDRVVRKPRLKMRSMVKEGKPIHWYEVDGTSAKGRGVTTLLGNGLPSGGLMQWAANKAADCALDERDLWEPLAERDRTMAYEYIRKASDRDRDAAAGRGTDVHDLAERIVSGQEVEVPEELLGMVDRFIDWLTDWEPDVVHSEFVIANWTRWYFGKSDLLVKVRGWWPDRPDDEALVLADIKTSRSGPFEKDALQLLAYGNAEEIAIPDEKGNCWELLPMPAVDGYAVLHLSADAYRFIPVRADLHGRLFATFLHAMRIAEFIGSGWKQEDKGWSRDVFLPAATPGGTA